MTTNDLVSRQDALALVRDVCDAIMSCCGSHYDEEVEDEVYDDIREVDAILKCNKEIRIALKNLPSAQPESKERGLWLTSDDMYETGVCSVCKYDSQEPVSYAITMFKFCPNCGADMRGEQDE